MCCFILTGNSHSSGLQTLLTGSLAHAQLLASWQEVELLLKTLAVTLKCKCTRMAAHKELSSGQHSGTPTALQKLEGFASRLFHRHSRGTTQEHRAALEDDGLRASEHTASWDKSSKWFGFVFKLIQCNQQLKYLEFQDQMQRIQFCLFLICIRIFFRMVRKFIKN